MAKGNMNRVRKICPDEKNVLRMHNESESNETTNGIFKLLNYKDKQVRQQTLIKMGSLMIHGREMLQFFHNLFRERS